jgi:hypothetical protein
MQDLRISGGELLEDGNGEKRLISDAVLLNLILKRP